MKEFTVIHNVDKNEMAFDSVFVDIETFDTFIDNEFDKIMIKEVKELFEIWLSTENQNESIKEV